VANKYAQEWPGNTQEPIPQAAPDFGASASAPTSSPAPLQNYLASMDDRQLETLQSQGQLSAEIVNAIKAQRAPMMPTNAPVDAAQNAALDSQSDQMVAGLQAGTGVPTSGPSATQVSNQNMGPVAQEVVGGALDSAGLQPPSVPAPNAPLGMPQIDPAQEQAAEQAATAQASAASGQAKAQAANAAKAQADSDRMLAEAQAKDAKLEEQVKTDLEEVPQLGSMIGQAIAIMMGAFSQGLTGAKENPGMVAIEKTLEREAQKRKYTQEQKDKQMEMALKQAQYQLEVKKANTSSMLELRKVQATEKEVGIKLAELQQKTAQNSMLSKLEFTNDEWLALRGEEGKALRERGVRMPNGNWRATSSKEGAEKLKELIPNAEAGKITVKKLMNKVDFFGNNPVKKVFARKEIGETQADLQDLVGQMRLPYTGTGAFTKVEQDMLRAIAGDPAKILSLDSTNKAKLMTIFQKFEIQKNASLRANGVDLPLTPNETKMEQMKKKYPTANETDIMNALIKSGKWDMN
jgi:hypothetical protein